MKWVAAVAAFMVTNLVTAHAPVIGYAKGDGFDLKWAARLGLGVGAGVLAYRAVK